MLLLAIVSDAKQAVNFRLEEPLKNDSASPRCVEIIARKPYVGLRPTETRAEQLLPCSFPKRFGTTLTLNLRLHDGSNHIPSGGAQPTWACRLVLACRKPVLNNYCFTPFRNGSAQLSHRI